MKRLVKLGWFHLDLPQEKCGFGCEDGQVVSNSLRLNSVGSKSSRYLGQGFPGKLRDYLRATKNDSHN
jgi:hypothetical protein